MSQVVEILDNFQSREENEEDQILQTGGSSSITLYEVPKGSSNDTPT